jgi:type II secretion system protein J
MTAARTDNFDFTPLRQYRGARTGKGAYVLHFTFSALGNTQHASRNTSAFTLIEVMLALAISAIVLAAVGGVFFTALHLRDRTAAMLDETASLYQAIGVIRRDFQGALPPGAAAIPTVGDFKCNSQGGGGNSSGSIQLYTTTGVLDENDPWGDVQEVVYELRDPTDNRQNGKDLVRSVSRNVLASGTQDAIARPLMGNVKSLEFACYDGAEWRDSWDTSLGDTNLPVAVRIRVRLAGDNNPNARPQEPYELVVALLSQSRTNQPASSSSGGGQ